MYDDLKACATRKILRSFNLTVRTHRLHISHWLVLHSSAHEVCSLSSLDLLLDIRDVEFVDDYEDVL